MKQLLRITAVVLVWSTIATFAAAAHPFHASIAEAEWNPQSGRFEVALRMNSLDLERALSAVTGESFNLERSEDAESLIRAYLSERFSISASSDADAEFWWVGMELEKLDLWTYFEIEPAGAGSRVEIQPAVTAATSLVRGDGHGGVIAAAREAAQYMCPDRLTLSNRVLFDVFPGQVNFVSLTVNGQPLDAHLTATQPATELVVRASANKRADDREAGDAIPTVIPAAVVQRVDASDPPDPFPAVAGMQRSFSTSFTDPSAAESWEFTDDSAWTLLQGDVTALSLTKKQSDFQPPYRSPFNRALLKDVRVGTFVLDVRLRSTIPDYNHRDLCLFFGYQDDAHLYYVHLGKRTDDHANQVFIVNDAPRVKISTRTTAGIPWDDDWHHVRLSRNLDTGVIAVYFDDLSEPVMTATDRTFGAGRVGIGSFDDTGDFDIVTLWTPAGE